MASNFRDCVLDRVHVLTKRISDLTAKDNPHRSDSTVKVAVIDEIEPCINELEILSPLLKRICKDGPTGL